MPELEVQWIRVSFRAQVQERGSHVYFPPFFLQIFSL